MFYSMSDLILSFGKGHRPIIWQLHQPKPINYTIPAILSVTLKVTSYLGSKWGILTLETNTMHAIQYIYCKTKLISSFSYPADLVSSKNLQCPSGFHQVPLPLWSKGHYDQFQSVCLCLSLSSSLPIWITLIHLPILGYSFLLLPKKSKIRKR